VSGGERLGHGEFSRPTTKKLGGRPPGAIGGRSRAIREAVLGLQSVYRVVTVRGAFYLLVAGGVVEKTESSYRSAQRQILGMRREGVLPWSFIADHTRWQRKPRTYDRLEDALADVQGGYRRNLWQRQSVRVEVWCEKDTLAGVVMEATDPWDVALMVSRGQSSDTFTWNAAQAAREAWRHEIETHIFALYDADRSGRNAAAKVREKLVRYSGGVPIKFDLLAVTDEQIDEWDLPTRPGKEDPSERAVELDAIPPDRLIALVEDAIKGLIDQDAWAMEKVVEEAERKILARMVGGEW
jgi:hypothetical protein